MSFDISGLDTFQKEIEDLVLTSKQKEKTLNKAVQPLYKNIKDEANSFKDTGKLSGSIKTKVKNNTAYVSSEEKHAFILEYSPKYNHFGWFSGAVENSESEVLKIIEDEIFK